MVGDKNLSLNIFEFVASFSNYLNEPISHWLKAFKKFLYQSPNGLYEINFVRAYHKIKFEMLNFLSFCVSMWFSWRFCGFKEGVSKKLEFLVPVYVFTIQLVYTQHVCRMIQGSDLKPRSNTSLARHTYSIKINQTAHTHYPCVVHLLWALGLTQTSCGGTQ